MKRDMELVRAILIAIESSPGMCVDSSSIEPAGWESEVVSAHLDLMIEAGLIDGEYHEFCGGGGDAYIRRLSWTGYDFLDSVRDETVWRETTASVARTVGSASFDVIKVLATTLAMRALGVS